MCVPGLFGGGRSAPPAPPVQAPPTAPPAPMPIQSAPTPLPASPTPTPSSPTPRSPGAGRAMRSEWSTSTRITWLESGSGLGLRFGFGIGIGIWARNREG